MLSPFLSGSNVHRRRHITTPPPVWTCHALAATETRSPAQREVRARRPCQPTAPPAALVHTHLHQINACPLILAGPFITFLTASVQPPNRAQEKKKREAPRRQVTPLHLRFVLGEKPPHDTDAPCSPKKAVEERKPYLSTQRCSRVEVVGYPQHPQHGKA